VALAYAKPEIVEFTERDLTRLFAYIDISSAQRITLFEFVKGIRGDLSAYRKAVVEFLYDCLDMNHDAIIDEQEMLTFYQSSSHSG
jgi:Ca2+-binding EF-hand superfamily protein